MVFTCFVGACSSNPDAKPADIITEKGKEALRYLKEVEWPKAYREQDTVLLDRILRDDFTMIDEGASSDKKRSLHMDTIIIMAPLSAMADSCGSNSISTNCNPLRGYDNLFRDCYVHYS